MNPSMMRHMILAIMVSAFVVTASATSVLGLQPSDSPGSYMLVAAQGSMDSMGARDSNISQQPSRNPQDSAKSDSSGTALPDCYQTCMTDNSGIMRSLCWLGCDYRPDGPPWVP